MWAEEKGDLNRLYLTLPIRRSQVVAGRYLMAFILYLAGDGRALCHRIGRKASDMLQSHKAFIAAACPAQSYGIVLLFRRKTPALHQAIALVTGGYSSIYLIPLGVFLLFSFSVNTFAAEEKGDLNRLYLKAQRVKNLWKLWQEPTSGQDTTWT